MSTEKMTNWIFVYFLSEQVTAAWPADVERTHKEWKSHVMSRNLTFKKKRGVRQSFQDKSELRTDTS